MDDLVQFVREQLDEDERIAREAGGVSWLRPEHPGETVVIFDSRGEPVVYDEGWPTEEQQAHIVAHDPSRVLREIDAKRRLLDDYTVTARIRDEAAARIKAAEGHPDAKDLETWDRAQREAAILEGPVKLAALPLADRPDYRDEWRP